MNGFVPVTKWSLCFGISRQITRLQLTQTELNDGCRCGKE